MIHSTKTYEIETAGRFSKVKMDPSAGKMGQEVAPQGLAHDVKQQFVAQTFGQNSSQSRFECCLDENNIPEDELPRPLSSGRGNCLPGCWAGDDPKIDIYMPPAPVWKHGDPVQCWGDARLDSHVDSPLMLPLKFQILNGDRVHICSTA